MKTLLCPMDHRDPNRRTGRTTRMLKEALSKAKSGEPVLIVAFNEPGISYMKSLFPNLAWPRNIGFMSQHTRDFIKHLGIVQGFSGHLFIDHAVWDYP